MTASRQEVVAVVGVANTGVIGRSGGIPWHSSADMRHFKQITMGHPIVMGRNTFQSIGRLLPGRLNVILTRDQTFHVPGALIVHSKEEALSRLAAEPKIMIIGGEQVYREFYDCLTRIELTQLNVEVDGDAYFDLDPTRDWRVVAETEMYDDKLGARLEFKSYVPDDTKNPYLNTDVRGLLQLFGAGEPVPGSGAAAALQALLAAYLIMTVVQISRDKNLAPAILRTMAQYAYRVSSTIVPRVRDLFLQDIEVFGEVVPMRRQRDAAAGADKARITRRLNAQMSEATEIPDEVFEIASELMAMAEFLYGNGYKAVRGDSGAAMSAALSSMLSCSFVIGINAGALRRSGGESWMVRSTERQQQCLAALARIPRYLAIDRPADQRQLTLDL